MGTFFDSKYFIHTDWNSSYCCTISILERKGQNSWFYISLSFFICSLYQNPFKYIEQIWLKICRLTNYYENKKTTLESISLSRSDLILFYVLGKMLLWKMYLTKTFSTKLHGTTVMRFLQCCKETCKQRHNNISAILYLKIFLVGKIITV